MPGSNAQFEELRQRLEELSSGLAVSFDDLRGRLKAIESEVGAIRLMLDERRRIDPGFVAGRLGLTPTQSEVAVALCEGKTVEGIARSGRRAVSTVRWHLKEIYSKLGITTQAQLVSLVLQLWQGMAGRRNPEAETPGACDRNPGG